MQLVKRRSHRIGSSSYKIFQIVNNIFLSFVGVLCLIPILNVLAMSFSSANAIAMGKVNLLPVEFTAQAYTFVLQNTDFWRSMGISIFRVTVAGGLGICLTILTAYPLSKSEGEFKARNFYVWFIYITMVFNGGLIPSFLIIKWVGLYDNIFALIIPQLINAWNCILMLNFFRNLPKELEESAVLDGAGHWTILTRIIAPISKPVIATVLLYIIVGHWNAWFDGSIFLANSKSYPLQTYLYSMTNFDPALALQSGASQEAIDVLKSLSSKNLNAAQIFLGTVPILLVYPKLQKYFTKGIMLGSVKG
jgi:putative aldouronate transport system permease protein